MHTTLVIVPTVGVALVNDALYMDVKFASGMDAYARYWPGKVKCVVRQVESNELPFGQLYDRDQLAWQVDVAEKIRPEALSDAAIASIAIEHHRDFPVARLCRKLGIPYVAVIVSTLKMNLQIAMIERKGLASKLRSCQWLLARELERISLIRRASGIQAYQVPAYRRYAKFSRNALMIFDSRNDDPISAEGLEERLVRLDSRSPLRLVFSGRLISIKGVDHFPKLMDLLPNATLDVYGSGALSEHLRHPRIRLHGAVDFGALMPRMGSSADLFICCHRQGDPSGTYMETLACGVPIAGYLNEAFAGILQLSDIGIGVKMNDVQALAAAIQTLDQDREQLKQLSRNSRSFACQHRFSETFKRRVEQLKFLRRM